MSGLSAAMSCHRCPLPRYFSARSHGSSVDELTVCVGLLVPSADGDAEDVALGVLSPHGLGGGHRVGGRRGRRGGGGRRKEHDPADEERGHGLQAAQAAQARRGAAPRHGDDLQDDRQGERGPGHPTDAGDGGEEEGAVVRAEQDIDAAGQVGGLRADEQQHVRGADEQDDEQGEAEQRAHQNANGAQGCGGSVGHGWAQPPAWVCRCAVAVPVTLMVPLPISCAK